MLNKQIYSVCCGLGKKYCPPHEKYFMGCGFETITNVINVPESCPNCLGYIRSEIIEEL